MNNWRLVTFLFLTVTTIFEYGASAKIFQNKVDIYLVAMVIINFALFQLVFYSLFSQPIVHFLTFMFVLFNFIFLFLVPQSLISTESHWFVNELISNVEKINAFYIVLMLLLITNIVTLFSISQSRNRDANSFVKENKLSPYKVQWMSFVYLVYIGFMLTFSRNTLLTLLPSGITNVFSTSMDLSLAQYGLGRALIQTTPVILSISCFILAREYELKRFQKFGIAFSFVSLIISLPIGSSRQMFLFSAIPLLLVIFKNSELIKRVSLLIIPLVTILGQPITFGITHSYSTIRNYGIGRIFNGVNFRIDELLSMGDFDSFSMFTLGLQSVKNGLELFPGRQLIGVLLFWIPRSFWNEKPFDTAVEISRFNELFFQNLSAPWILELYMNGGLILLFAGAILIPLFISRLDFFASNSDRGLLRQLILSGSIFILLRGSLLQAFGIVAYSLLLVQYLTKRKSKSS